MIAQYLQYITLGSGIVTPGDSPIFQLLYPTNICAISKRLCRFSQTGCHEPYK
nr:hypothetical protein PJ912_18175 [Pectobacterium colocasium]